MAPATEDGDGALDGVGRVLGVAEAQADDLPGGVGHDGGERPDQARLLTGAVAGLCAVGHAQHGHRPCRARQGERVARFGEQGAGESALQDHAVGRGGVQPVARGEQRMTDGGALGRRTQFDRRAGAA